MARLLLLAVSLGLIALAYSPAAGAAIQLLQNGGFEAGAAGWSGVNMSVAGCAPRSQPAALSLTASPSGQAVAQQTVTGVAAGLGPYTFSGYAKLGTGTPMARATLRWLDGNGGQLLEYQTPISAGASYGSFTVVTAQAPPASASVVVIVLVTGNGTVCIDDLALEGPAPVTLTPTPTLTLTMTPAPTNTPTPPPPTNTPRPPTPTQTPTAPRTGAGGGGGASGGGAGGSGSAGSAAGQGQAEEVVTLGVVNGGFEEGVSPWQKFGGTLQAVSAPARSGQGSGAFSSSTTSTKWAYQVVRVQPGATYEFTGYVRVGQGVAESYLRVSWYASGDGSGTTMGSVDSTQKLAAGSDFVLLTTGAIEAPPGANSARVRVMLAPAGAGPASIYLDDFAFGPSQAAAPASAALVPPSPEDDATEPPPASSSAPSSAAPAASAAESPAASTEEATPAGGQVAAAGGGAEPPVRRPDQGAAPELRELVDEGKSPLLYVLAVVGLTLLTGAAFVSALWYSRRGAA